MSDPIRVAFVVNSHGIQERRALALARRLPAGEFTSTVSGAPSWRDVRRQLAAADVIYVIDPGRRGLPAALAARLARRPVIVEVGDPQAALYRGQGRHAWAVASGWAIDQAVARGSSAVVVRGPELLSILGVRVPSLDLPDGVDLDVFRPTDAAGLRRELGIDQGELVVGLTGSLNWSERFGFGYGWDIVEALGLLPDEPVRALLVGQGSGVPHLRRRAAELGVGDRLSISEPVAHERIPEFLSAMDVCVSTQSNDTVGRGRTTAKLPEYLACDRFVVATRVGRAADVLPDEMLLPYQGTVDRDHPARLAAKLRSLAPRQRELQNGAGTRTIAATQFSYDVLARRLAMFLHEVAGR